MKNRKSIKVAAVIIATDHGEEMRSNTPKVLHPLLGRPSIWYMIEAAQGAAEAKPILVTGQGWEQVQQEVGQAANFVIQEPQQGSGQAVLQTKGLLSDKTDYLLVITANIPLLTSGTLEKVVTAHHHSVNQNKPAPPFTILKTPLSKSSSDVRLDRDENGPPVGTQASTEQLELHEFNTSVYCFTADWLWQALARIPRSSSGEYDLADLAPLAAADGLPVQTLTLEDSNEAIEINNRVQLAEAEATLQERINASLMLNGVTFIDPKRTYIQPGVEIGIDTVIWPNTYLQGATQIGKNCTIGPDCSIHDTKIGDRCKVVYSFTEGAILEDNVDIGPFARLRKGAHLANGVHMGNFGEIKNAYLGPGTKMGHFSYIGDAKIGPEVNIGAGVITANYDGKQKYTTEIGAGAFIGSDSMLVAPVKIGEGARTGAGAVVTKDVPPNTLAVGMPARAIRKKEEDDGS
ncbi:bifunctional UDP-N-acetylglucosamine diphosphorylase/glucosamine-1-phosphate N-acetyltransferase GlmU [Chloroflexota bacterium]